MSASTADRLIGLSVESVSQFLYREARYLDERRYRDWLGLLDDEVRYWMPIRRVPVFDTTTTDRAIDHELTNREQLAYFDDDRATLELRVNRIECGLAWAEEPPSMFRRIIANIEVVPGAEPDVARVHSNFLLYRSRFADKQETLVGHRTDLIRDSPGGLRLTDRTVVLEGTVVGACNISTFL